MITQGTGFETHPLPQIGTFPNNNITNNNNHGGGMKRLASCREELERSWEGVTAPLRHCISNDNDIMGMTSDDDEEDDGNLHMHGRAKRRRTISPNNGDNSSNYMMEEDDDCRTQPLTKSLRISPSNRPRLTSVPIKAGWYEGEVDEFGNRHGMGITKNDDGTEYEGTYYKDIMEGNGRYQFVTTRHLVPNPHNNGSYLHRQQEKSFVGSFKQDIPYGSGMTITKTVDCMPQVLGSLPLDIRFMEVQYDLCIHKNNAVGEGVRIIYSTKNDGDRSTLELTCFRLCNGNNTNVRVANDYAKWIVQCMGAQFPGPPPLSVPTSSMT